MTTITSRRRRRSSSTRRSEVATCLAAIRALLRNASTEADAPADPDAGQRPLNLHEAGAVLRTGIWFSRCWLHALLRCRRLLRRRSEGLQRDDSDQQSNNDNSHDLPPPLLRDRIAGTNAAVRCFHGMGSREEDNGVFLLIAVAFVCGMIAFVPWLLEPTPAVASKSGQRVAYERPASQEPVRVIVPFTPNTTPSQR